jgi:CRP/FNR family cyclic AMP-dependent transcriptional regulator
VSDTNVAEQTTKNETLQALEYLGEGSTAVQRIFAMIGHARFFSDFTPGDIDMLARNMLNYRAQAGQTIIREGDIDDYMLLIIEGQVEILKHKGPGQGGHQPMTIVGPGATLGEMSMIDGEPRFATCVAAETTTFAALSRDGMVKIILEEPSLGAKILIKLVTLLSARLRQTSQSLLQQLER